MENELIITREFIKTNYPIENIVNIFNECFPNGAKISEFPKIRPYLEKARPNFKAIYNCFAGWLLKVLPFNETPLEFDSTNIQDDIIYNGDIHIKSDVTLVNSQIYLTGTLKINGKLAISGNGFILSYRDDYVIANEIYNDGGYICGKAIADKVTLINGGQINGDIITKSLYTDLNTYETLMNRN